MSETNADFDLAAARKSGNRTPSKPINMVVIVDSYDVEKGLVFGKNSVTGEAVAVSMTKIADEDLAKMKARNKNFFRPDIKTWTTPGKKQVSAGGAIAFETAFRNSPEGETPARFSARWGTTVLNSPDRGATVAMDYVRVLPQQTTSKGTTRFARVEVMQATAATKVSNLDGAKAAIIAALNNKIEGAGKGSALIRVYQASTGAIVTKVAAAVGVYGEDKKFIRMETPEETADRVLTDKLLSQAIVAGNISSEVIPVVELQMGADSANKIEEASIKQLEKLGRRPFALPLAEGQKKVKIGWGPAVITFQKRANAEGKDPIFVTSVVQPNQSLDNLRVASAVVTANIAPTKEHVDAAVAKADAATTNTSADAGIEDAATVAAVAAGAGVGVDADAVDSTEFSLDGLDLDLPPQDEAEAPAA